MAGSGGSPSGRAWSKSCSAPAAFPALAELIMDYLDGRLADDDHLSIVASARSRAGSAGLHPRPVPAGHAAELGVVRRPTRASVAAAPRERAAAGTSSATSRADLGVAGLVVDDSLTRASARSAIAAADSGSSIREGSTR